MPRPAKSRCRTDGHAATWSGGATHGGSPDGDDGIVCLCLILALRSWRSIASLIRGSIGQTDCRPQDQESENGPDRSW